MSVVDAVAGVGSVDVVVVVALLFAVGVGFVVSTLVVVVFVVVVVGKTSVALVERAAVAVGVCAYPSRVVDVGGGVVGVVVLDIADRQISVAGISVGVVGVVVVAVEMVHEAVVGIVVVVAQGRGEGRSRPFEVGVLLAFVLFVVVVVGGVDDVGGAAVAVAG